MKFPLFSRICFYFNHKNNGILHSNVVEKRLYKEKLTVQKNNEKKYVRNKHNKYHGKKIK